MASFQILGFRGSLLPLKNTSEVFGQSYDFFELEELSGYWPDFKYHAGYDEVVSWAHVSVTTYH